MKIIQMLPSLAFGDAVSNDALAIREVLSRMGYETRIYAENIQYKLQGQARAYRRMERTRKSDVVLYHHSIGADMAFDFEKLSCRKVMIYHNITPPEFFDGYDNRSKRLMVYGQATTKCLADKVDYCLADSEYNKQELRAMGYTCPIDVRPILIPFSDYEQEPDAATLRQYRDGVTNILFVGRIAPNKKFEDVIRAFCYYKTQKNPNSRLILVGSCGGMENYQQALEEYAAKLGIRESVVFSGHVSFGQILAFYRAADLFLCMSEHEGFCVPLVEAMFFGVPIVAYASTAIPSTLGGSGALAKEKDPVFVGELMHRILSDEQLKAQLIAGQKERLKDFSYEKISAQLIAYLQTFLGRETR